MHDMKQPTPSTEKNHQPASQPGGNHHNSPGRWLPAGLLSSALLLAYYNNNMLARSCGAFMLVICGITTLVATHNSHFLFFHVAWLNVTCLLTQPLSYY
jgi:hypothetical protein